MPFKEEDKVSKRHSFVLRALEPGANMSALCREYEITRATGYKWRRRYKERGFAGLEELARGPKRGRSPLGCSADIAVAVLRLRLDYPDYGAPKLQAVLARQFPHLRTPSERTVGRILERAGVSRPSRGGRKPGNGPKSAPAVVAERPNDVWSVDFKGWWRTKNNTKVEPLTVQDRFSRCVLAAQILDKPSFELVQAEFIRLFKANGLPRAIQTDGGPPFAATTGVIGLSRLSAWWISLGIEWYRSRPGCPQDNGGHERMHRDMAQDLERHPAWDRRQQQEHCDRWRHTFNHHRPHQALVQRVPADVYCRSTVLYTTTPIELTYPDHMHRRKVSKRGNVRFLGPPRYLSIAVGGYHVGFEPLPDDQFRIWLRDRCIAEGSLPWVGKLRPPPLWT